MRYEKGHKEATRAHIIDVASRQFRGQGVAAVGLAGIMSDAGLTNGAFYNHFESKEDLVQAVLAKALDRREERLQGAHTATRSPGAKRPSSARAARSASASSSP